MNPQEFKLTEEHVTRKLAKTLADSGHEIVAVHPPDGQGPFVIPKPKLKDDIERSSYHPDVVSLCREDGTLYLYISECKLHVEDLSSDRDKLLGFASSYESLIYAFFRCQSFKDGPELGFDFEYISRLPASKLPIRFILSAGSTKEQLNTSDVDIGAFECRLYLFSFDSLLSS